MIEDNPEYANEIASCGTKTFLIEKPWNKNSKLHHNVIRVKNLQEVLNFLKNK
jgi:uncharacterized HAD superfamily protein